MFHKNDLFHTTMAFDLRAPEQFGVTSSQIVGAALDMVEYADKHGIDSVTYQEHHQSEDGYLPCPFLMGTAAAQRTSKIGIVMGAVILPFHNPVEVAEQIAYADVISGGRIYTVLAGGYSPTEFDAFGVKLSDRAQIMEEGFDLILRALSGERFMAGGREVFVRPLPTRDPREIVYGGGGSPASARRAARFGLSMWPMNDSIIPHYEAECAKLGKEPGLFIRGANAVYVTDDPERGWDEIGPHLLHYMQGYAKWSSDPKTSTSPLHGLDTIEKIRAAGIVKVITPEEAIKIGREGPIGLQPLVGGLHPDVGWKSFQMFVDKVLPYIKDAPVEWRKSQGLAA